MRPGDIVVDIGANIGVHSLPMARRAGQIGATVFAFEAAPDTADRLESNAIRNEVRLEVVRRALGATFGRATLSAAASWDPSDTGVRSLFGDGPSVCEVQVVTFDSWAEERRLSRLDLVKVDVEGAEMAVLQGMEGSLARLRPRLIVVEVVPDHLRRAGSSPEALAAFFEGLGYVSDGPSVSAVAGGNTGGFWPNVVMRPTGAAA
jgi:FkbM family methyltransferase